MNLADKDKIILSFLKKNHLFKSVSPSTLNYIKKNMEEKIVRNHEFLYSKGEESEHIYLIRYGEIIIENFEKGGNIYVGPGDILSENSLLTGNPHSASAYAVIDTLVYAIPGKVFMKLASRDRVLSQNILKLLSSRMREQLVGKALNRTEPRRLYCHIPLDNIEDFSVHLASLVQESYLLHSSASTILNISQFKGMGLDKFAESLSQLRKKTPLVHLYFDTPETSLDLPGIVLQSDWLVFWNHQTEKNIKIKSEVFAFWKLRLRNFNGRTILYQMKSPAPGTEVSTDFLRGSSFHKIFYQRDALARFLVDRTRGLALGGGGARALAHLGLLKQLEKDGIKFDSVSGASFGAVIGALYARGDTIENMEKLTLKFFGGLESAFDPTLPLISFFKGKKMRKMLQEAFGDLRIEELPIKFMTSAVDLQTGKEYIFDRGQIVEALVASMSLPGAFPPFFLGEKVLVDGGMVNNVPDDLLRERGADLVMGVNVSPLQETVSLKIFEDRKSSGKSLFRYFWDNFKYPPILKIMGRSIAIGGREITRLKILRMQLFINLHLEEFQLFDFVRFREIIDKGEKESIMYKKEIRSLFLPNKKFH